jgi:hypothetical protein
LSDERRAFAKRVLGGLPFAAEAVYRLRSSRRAAIPGYSLGSLVPVLPAWRQAALAARENGGSADPRRVLILGYLPWWLEHGCALGLLLAAEGHRVHLAFLPYRSWEEEIDAFDARRQALFLQDVLGGLAPAVSAHNLLAAAGDALPPGLGEALERQSRIDAQYTLQRETLDLDGDGADQRLLALRRGRNRRAASAAVRLIRRGAFDVVIVPNGSILEFGAVYQTARHLGMPVVTYEFGEQRARMWLAQSDEVMRLDTRALWEARGATPLTEAERDSLGRLYQARRAGAGWANFSRRWQAEESQGAQAARRALGLDPRRPVALLCTNVVADSLALGRQIFTQGMADWLAHTVRFFARRPDVQLVVRVHPGELLGAGHPSVEIVRSELPRLPQHVLVVPPESHLNTYDLIELAHVGLVYTTTVGMEMAMSGVPVAVAGETHYRGKGFTYDPDSLESYFEVLERLLRRPIGERLSQEQADLAQRYAYRFFFEYPFPFPWHLIKFWDDIAARPLEKVVQMEVRGEYARTLDALVGKPIDWRAPAALALESAR